MLLRFTKINLVVILKDIILGPVLLVIPGTFLWVLHVELIIPDNVFLGIDTIAPHHGVVAASVSNLIVCQCATAALVEHNPVVSA